MGEVTDFKGRVQASAPAGPEAEADALIQRVGDRVRKARELRGIPRRVLSELSGVSPRYLAQLEAGEGNISIGLLSRVATALDHRIEWFLADDDPWSSDALRITDLFRAAPADLRARALAILSPNPMKACARNAFAFWVCAGPGNPHWAPDREPAGSALCRAEPRD